MERLRRLPIWGEWLELAATVHRLAGGRPTPAGFVMHHMVAADNLNPQKARILLMLALTRTREIGEIGRMFDAY
jgi:L-asparaginase